METINIIILILQYIINTVHQYKAETGKFKPNCTSYRNILYKVTNYNVFYVTWQKYPLTARLCFCWGWSLFVPLRNFSRIKFPPDKSVTVGSVINNIKLWTSGWWYNVPTDFPTALAGTSSLSALPPSDIMISSLCDWVPSLISWVCCRVFLMGPSLSTHTRSGRASGTRTWSKDLWQPINEAVYYLRYMSG